jgi:hypothetical protein
MNVSYVAPLQRAWARAERMLFRPFRLEMWLVLGFAAFLSEWFSSSTGMRFGYHGHRGPEAIPGRVIAAVGNFLQHPVWTLVLIALVTLAAILAIVLLWISCRGRFIFLDNVAHERTGIVEPWARFRRLGNSLFVWALLFTLVCIAVMVVITLPFLASLVALFSDGRFALAQFASLGALLLMAIPLGIVAAYITLFLSDFVVPIMYKHDLTVMAAWGRFLSLLQAHPGSFLLYGLFVLLLHLVVGFVVVLLGIMSCCVGLILLAIPYVGHVILLPVYATFRALGPEFLAQFGPDLAVLAAAPARPAAAPGPAAPAAPGGGAGL